MHLVIYIIVSLVYEDHQSVCIWLDCLFNVVWFSFSFYASINCCTVEIGELYCVDDISFSHWS